MLFSLLVLVVTAFAALLTIMSLMVAMQATTLRETTTPFECGFDPKNSARVPFSLRFFLLAVIFLIFDVEVALLLPLPIALASTPMMTLLTAVILLIILLWGLLHEWREGSLDWA